MPSQLVPEKVGRDVGELCGIDPIGVLATDDVKALLTLEPEEHGTIGPMSDTGQGEPSVESDGDARHFTHAQRRKKRGKTQKPDADRARR